MLSIVATPIGNLDDISLRALKVLRSADLILCEDTRVTRKLLNRYQIKTRLLSYHQHSKLKKLNQILDLLKQDRNLALVSDAGTPGISDPGNKLIAFLVEKMPDLEIVSIPGPSAITAALSVSGFPTDKFCFFGFPPNKKKRKKFFSHVLTCEHRVVIFESPHRIMKTLEQLKSLERELDKQIKLVVCQELTKKFEKIYRGSIDEVLDELRNNPIKGEFVIVINQN